VDYTELADAHDHAATLCTCGASAVRCTHCHGTGWTPRWTQCQPCEGIGGTRSHDIECPAWVDLIEYTAT
jgi:RecJ-like exonuclease